MKLSLSLFVVAASAWCFTQCSGARTVGSGKLASEPRAVSNFHGVELAATGTLDITQGDKEELTVEAEDNILPLIETRVKPDGTLLITFKSNEEVRTTKPLSFKLSVKTLDKIVLAGSGDIRVAGKLSAENETIKLPGSGTVTLDRLETGALTVKLEGSGKIKIASGGAASQSVQLDGSGDYEAGALKTDATKVSLDGSGECKVWAEKSLEANIGGSGEVAYYGSPAVKQRVAGSGAVLSLGAKGS